MTININTLSLSVVILRDTYILMAIACYLIGAYTIIRVGLDNKEIRNQLCNSSLRAKVLYILLLLLWPLTITIGLIGSMYEQRKNKLEAL